MRVALIAPPWLPVPPQGYGGIELMLDVLARGLQESGHEVLLITTGDSVCPVPRRHVYQESQPDEMGTTTIELRHLLYAYDTITDVDIVHDHTVAGPLLALLRSGRPVVTTCHGPFTDDARALYRATADRVPVVAISRHQASTALDVPIARVIHHGLDSRQFPVGRGDGGFALFLGRMSPTKGVQDAILIARQADMPLVMATKQRDQHERDYFDSVIRPLLGADITYVGEVTGAEKLELLGGAVALLNPLRWHEPFGLNMIEALACGTPVVATPRGSVPEIVDDGVTGILASTTADLADALRLAGRLDRRCCRAAVERRFSMQRMTADHLGLYADVLTGAAFAHRDRCGGEALGHTSTRSALHRERVTTGLTSSPVPGDRTPWRGSR